MQENECPRNPVTPESVWQSINEGVITMTTDELCNKVRELETRDPIRNHGIFSKAERALQFADWSEHARNDIEIFVIEATDGLTPLLMVLSDPHENGTAATPTRQLTSASSASA